MHTNLINQFYLKQIFTRTYTFWLLYGEMFTDKDTKNSIHVYDNEELKQNIQQTHSITCKNQFWSPHTWVKQTFGAGYYASGRVAFRIVDKKEADSNKFWAEPQTIHKHMTNPRANVLNLHFNLLNWLIF